MTPALPHHGHRSRLRERLRKDAALLADYEILELLLGYALPRRDTKPLAKELLARFKSLRGVLEAPEEALRDLDGIGPGVQAFFALLRECRARFAESALPAKTKVTSTAMVAAMARERLAGRSHEEVWLAYLDTQNRMLSWEKYHKGTVDASVVYPRDILERCLLLKASAFIIVHNHPGGSAAPSGADLQITEQLKRSAQALGVRFLDHLIVTDAESFSLLNDGLLDGV
ncbi:DNA repair protein RadC [Desulfovibrio sp. OttesenSCG-928-C14]|nr:DNA repair protein RadC [Desulfovibrio sp. OttesenSCG-928-C14]